MAYLLGTTATNAGIFLSLLFTLSLIFLVAMATKGKRFELMGLITAMFSTVLFTAMSWYPLWTGAILAFAVALLGGWYLSRLTGGGSGG